MARVFTTREPTGTTSEARMTLRRWLADRPFTLALSSGFFGFFAHAGVLAALEDVGLSPAGACGSSAGALVAGAWAAGVSGAEIGAVLCALRREDFWDPALGVGLLRGARFRRRLEALLPVERFEQTRAPLQVSVFDLFERRTRVVTSGALARAIHASCAVPLLFQPVWIDGHPMIDGGVADRPGISGLPPTTRVLFHHLASRSPWRLRPPAIPARADLSALVIEGLPRPGPFRLAAGSAAFVGARAATRRALSRPIGPQGQLRISV